MDVSIVIPVFNASPVIASSVTGLVSSLSGSAYSFEILLWDDGSRDDSAAQLEAAARRYPSSVRWFQNPVNRGLGFTLRSLWDKALGDVVIYMDADLPFGSEAALRLYEQMEGADLVVASRYTGLAQGVRLRRRLASVLYYCLCRILFGVTVRDLGSGSVALRRAVIPSLGLKAEGFDIHIEVFYRARKHHCVVREWPAASTGPGLESFSILRHGPVVIGQTVKFWARCVGERRHG